MTRRALPAGAALGCVGRVGLLLALGSFALGFVPGSAHARGLKVAGGTLVDGGQPVRLLGVYRAGGEAECTEGDYLYQGPTDDQAIDAMRAWNVNAVAISVNEICWLGENGVVPARGRLGGRAYRAALKDFVARLRAHGLYVVLTLVYAAPGRLTGRDLLPMPDANHAPRFWRSFAAAFRRVDGVLFNLYVEPHEVSWRCWRDGCRVTGHLNDPNGLTYRPETVTYRAAGMQQLVNAVRKARARQPILLAGLGWASDLSGWLKHLPRDPQHALVAAVDTFDFNPCYADCRATLAAISARAPVVTVEVGDTDCNSDYTLDYMRWADAQGVSYLAWTWAAGEGWVCDGGNPDHVTGGGPTLISDWTGTPTGFGAGVRDHLSKVNPQPPARMRQALRPPPRRRALARLRR